MLKIGYLRLDNPLGIVSPNGSSNLGSLNGSAGLVMLGRFDLFKVDPLQIRRAMEEGRIGSALGFSTSGGDTDDLVEAGRMAAEEGRLMEVVLPRTDDIGEVVRAVKGTGAALSVRASPDAVEDLKALGRELKEAGADLLHLDLRRAGPGAAKVVKRISEGGSPPIMVRIDVGDFKAAKEILSMGADMISLSDKADPEFVDWLADALKRYQTIVGWYNAPKHICSGGDLRAISFCCPPVKSCPLLGALKKLGVSPEEFVELKISLTRGTPLEPGEGTCFGSLAWCCKITKPCFMRDAVLERRGISPDEYMRLKKKLAEDLLER